MRQSDQLFKTRIQELGELRIMVISQIPVTIALSKPMEKLSQMPSNKKFKSLKRHHYLGEDDKYYWLKFNVDVPKGDFTPAVWLDFGPFELIGAEGLMYINGNPYQGVDRNHSIVTLRRFKGKQIDIAVKIYLGHSVPYMKMSPRLFERCDLVAIDEKISRFYYLLNAIYESYKALAETDPDKHFLCGLLEETFQKIDYTQPRGRAFRSSINSSYEFVEKAVSKAKGHKFEVTNIGHAHIDTAWMWTLEVTREKCQRTFSTMLKLMDDYPDFTFIQTQPQLYKFIKEDFPELYARIKKKALSGQWETEGAMWVEADCNIPSGEALIRQIIYGKKFFREEFGYDSRLLWLPDSFGYTWALPQLLKKSNVDYFMTTKLSWSQYNKLPHDTFIWRGIDGTEILTHFITTASDSIYTYNGMGRVEEHFGLYKNYSEKKHTSHLLNAVGYGDGGGGTTQEAIETAHALGGFQGSPMVRFGKALDYFRHLERQTKGKLNKWNGELYLELHRGTYTTQAQIKKANRKAEIALRDAEILSVLSAEMPKVKMLKLWHTLLLNQFHDILPGSSIGEVYKEASTQLDGVLKECALIQKKCLRKIGKGANSPAFFNTLSFKRNALIEMNASSDFIQDASEKTYRLQRVRGRKKIAFVELPPMGWTTFTESRKGEGESANAVQISDLTLENKYLRVRFNKATGELASIYHKETKREVLPQGLSGNRFEAFEDKPLSKMLSAWDIDITYRDKRLTGGKLVKLEVLERGPVRAGFRVTKKLLNSVTRQHIYLISDSPLIYFDTEVDWKEREILLKVAFPVNILAVRAAYEIQFGAIERPTHFNTTWDRAKFEVPAQRWADISEYGFGVALINDCKYGYDCYQNVLRLTLLRGAVNPDPDADIGTHSFSYALYPHPGTYQQAQVIEKGYGFNVPAHHFTAAKESQGSYFTLAECPGVIIEAVKPLEAGVGFCIRLYEAYGRKTEAALQINLPFSQVYEANLLEERTARVRKKGSKLNLSLKPYEIKTLVFTG